MEPTSDKPRAWDYLSSREYATAYDSWAKEKQRGYSRRALAKWAGIASPNFLTLIIGGQRTFSTPWIKGFAKAAHLVELEASYLKLLVEWEQESDPAAKEAFLLKIEMLLADRRQATVIGDRLTLLTKPLAWTLVHMLDLFGQDGSAAWFKSKLLRKTSSEEILEGLKLLERLGLAKKESSGRFTSTHKTIATPDQIKSAENAIFHRYALDEARETLEKLDPSQRAFGSLSVTLPESQVEEFKAEVNRFGRKLLEKYGTTVGRKECLYRMNIQVYPLTKI